jgi:ferritin-like metal-binding protein YciE
LLNLKQMPARPASTSAPSLHLNRNDPMTIDTLDALLLHRLKGTLYAERVILRGLRSMEQKASAAQLKAAFAAHRAETGEHLIRLERAFDALDVPVHGKRCQAITSLIEEAEGLTATMGTTATLDAALIAVAQTIKHHEIARYCTLVTLAMTLGRPKLAALFKGTLDDETAANAALSRLADERMTAASANFWWQS